MRTAEELASFMAASALSPSVQIEQTRHRIALVEHWKVPEGARVLEIGCGQGDMTAVLADAVGERGRVLAVDIADHSYGAPVTIGDSMGHLSKGPLGRQIEYKLGVDVLKESFDSDAFDIVVLAHCTWYFDSLDRLSDILRRVRAWAPRLCLSEWDLQPRSIDQLGHLLAVLVQGQIEAFRSDSEANVRTPYSRETLDPLLSDAGWRVESEKQIDASNLDDARWEIKACLSDALADAEALDMPVKLRALLKSQLDVLSRLRGFRPLAAYSIVAARAD